MNRKFRVSFYLRSNYVNSEGKTSIMLRVYLNKERITLGATACSVDPKKWNGTLCRMKGRTADAQILNEQLNRIEADLMYIFRRHEFAEELSLDLIKSEYLGVNVKKVSFIDFFDDFLRQVKEEVGITRANASYQKFNVLKKHFMAYLQKDYKRKDLLMNELNFKIISGFEHYLLTAGKCQHNTVMRMMGNLKTITIRAFKSGLIKQDPFALYKIKFNKTNRGFLSEAEIQTLMSKEFAIPRMAVVRDIFIFSCFTGLAYIDVAQLMPENIVEVNGRKWIMTKRQKTNVPSNVLLLDVAEAIIKKYQGQDPKGRILPILSNQRMNSYLKEIADVCGIPKKLTFHLARHTLYFPKTMTITI